MSGGYVLGDIYPGGECPGGICPGVSVQGGYVLEQCIAYNYILHILQNG